MEISTVCNTKTDKEALAAAIDSLQTQLSGRPDYVVAHYSVDLNPVDLMELVRERYPGARLHGGSSCLGVITEVGFCSESGSGFGLMGYKDSGGSFGVGAAEIGDKPSEAAKEAVLRALEDADRPGEVPAIIYMTAAPGCEEQLIEGITEVVGSDVPISGGSAADNTVSGEWHQVANDKDYTNAVVISVMFPSSDVFFGFLSGYEPTEKKGIVTKADKRSLMEIDNRPAAEVYNDWCDSSFEDVMEQGGNILSRCTMFPLGRIVGQVGEIPYFQLSHPDNITSEKHLVLFSEVNVGDEIYFMQGTQDSLVSRAGRVASSALDTFSSSPDDIAGALVVYCAGCMLSVQDRLDEVVDSLNKALPETPILGTFTFGEQGCFVGGENRHGNLMISVLLFTK